ncbi:FAD-dependent oxidoreductase [Raoultibacter massiliensis]|uniref:FAD-dependent oxidoreductase n=1 Tax=Raoultibacter massiliensis TaxID=1852371 RepID=A0ABV1JFK7_9ACTN|nr:FAD-dependent oxidoreductase [Raoultibacter massiliensis]
MKEGNNITRRSFLGGAAIGALSLGMLGGCAPKAQDSAEATAPTATGELIQSVDNQAKYSFEIPPEPIADSDIAETTEHDVVVIGSGPSGLCTALSCLEKGVDVVLFTASSQPIGRGGSYQAFGSKFQKEMGVEYDKHSPELKRVLMMEQYSAGHVTDQQKWSRWIENSAETMDWMLDIMEKQGLHVMLENGYEDPEGFLDSPPSSHCFYTDDDTCGPVTGAPKVAKAFATEYESQGGEIHWKTRALYLIRDNDNTGRVSAVVAERKDGTYVKYVARKGIVMATGDFSSNREMMAKYAPFAYDAFKDVLAFTDKQDDVNYDLMDSFVGIYPGDGHKMGLWVGAAWQNAPVAPMINCGAIGPKYHYAANFWGINLDANGNRFMRETTNFAYAAYPVLMNPDHCAYYVWDTGYASRSEHGWSQWGCSYKDTNGTLPLTREEEIARWEKEVEAGNWVKGDTLDELLAQMEGLDVENAKATIERYNGYAESGRDEEYQVNPDFLFPIAEGPFYGAKTKIGSDFSSGNNLPSFLTICGGLRTDEHNRVCDSDNHPIEGLYNVGIMTGDFYAGIYSFAVFGQNHGACCLTLPHLLASEFAEMS